MFLKQMPLTHSLFGVVVSAHLTPEKNKAKKASSALRTPKDCHHLAQQTGPDRESIKRLHAVNTQDNSHQQDADLSTPSRT